ncbi:MAG: glucosamine inositolphosphorylceramide transferase family protein [Puniceicoccales bacterium]
MALPRILPGQQWSLLAGKFPALPASLGTLTELRPPRDRSWADPFPVVRDGRCWVFLVEVIHHPKKGRIAVMELHADGSTGPLTVLIERDYHLSYPFVFEQDGTWWMIPESRANHTVDLYRCHSWPDNWQHEMTLFSGTEIVDSTLWESEGRWWLFGGTPSEPGGNASGQLCLWSADTFLTDQWAPHPANPIVADRTCARPAGRLFRHDNQVIRPAQDCSVRYGYGVRLMAVNQLSPEAYRETELKAYLPNWDRKVRATHTFNRAGDWLLGDCARRIWPG